MSGRTATPPELAGAAYEQRVRQQAQRLKEELIRQTLEDVTSWARAVDDKWANDHPGLPFNSPIPREEVAQYRERVRTQDYEWIVPGFERFLVPGPDELDPALDALARIEGMFEGEADFTDLFVQEEQAAGAMRMIAGVVGDHRQEGARSNRSGPFVVATPALADATPAQLMGGAFRPAG